MARRKESPQKAAMREMMRGYLKENDICIKDGTDVNAVMRDMMSVLLEGVLDEELDEELGYSKYDYKSKDCLSQQRLCDISAAMDNGKDIPMTLEVAKTVF